jgi:hypothetical protein
VIYDIMAYMAEEKILKTYINEISEVYTADLSELEWNILNPFKEIKNMKDFYKKVLDIYVSKDELWNYKIFERPDPDWGRSITYKVEPPAALFPYAIKFFGKNKVEDRKKSYVSGWDGLAGSDWIDPEQWMNHGLWTYFLFRCKKHIENGTDKSATIVADKPIESENAKPVITETNTDDRVTASNEQRTANTPAQIIVENDYNIDAKKNNNVIVNNEGVVEFPEIEPDLWMVVLTNRYKKESITGTMQKLINLWYQPLLYIWSKKSCRECKEFANEYFAWVNEIPWNKQVIINIDTWNRNTDKETYKRYSDTKNWFWTSFPQFYIYNNWLRSIDYNSTNFPTPSELPYYVSGDWISNKNTTALMIENVYALNKPITA